MKNKKIILLILVILLFTGCSVNYDLYINGDLTVNEKVTASEVSDSLKTKTGMEPKNAANSLYELYKIDGVKYSFTTSENNSVITSTATTSFKSLDDYEEYFKSDIIKEVNITKKGSYITLKYKQDVPLSVTASRSLIYDSIAVNINVPFKVTENNADKVKGNTYTWYINKDGELKDIKITFNKDETINSKTFNFGFFEINVNYQIAMLVGLILIVLLIVLFVYIKNKKNNRI